MKIAVVQTTPALFITGSLLVELFTITFIYLAMEP